MASNGISDPASPNKDAELILGLRPANERRSYFVTTFLIGWAHA